MTTAQPLVPAQSDRSSLLRPIYCAGHLLEEDDLNVGVAYTRDLMRLVLKSMFGCGVICGLKITVTPTCKDQKRLIEIAKGVALDGMGNVIELPKRWSYEYDPGCDKPFPKRIWVTVCYHEKCCRPKDAACCSSDDDGAAKDSRVRAGYQVRLYDVAPGCACRCHSPADDDPVTGVRTPCGCGGHVAAPAPAAPQTPSTPGAVTPQEEKPCECYLEHYHGECECDCNCECVVIGILEDPGTIVEVKPPTGPTVRTVEIDDTMVRRIRPVLNGYLQCRDAQKPPAPQEPAQPTTPVIN